MKIIIDTQEMEDANEFGETLRDYCFVPDEFGGETGCYSTFKLRDDFVEVKPNSKTGKKLLKSLWNDCHNKEYIKEMTPRVQMFTDGIIDLAWCWDGDGILLIKEGSKVAINSDCKKDHDWEWITC